MDKTFSNVHDYRNIILTNLDSIRRINTRIKDIFIKIIPNFYEMLVLNQNYTDNDENKTLKDLFFTNITLVDIDLMTLLANILPVDEKLLTEIDKYNLITDLINKEWHKTTNKKLLFEIGIDPNLLLILSKHKSGDKKENIDKLIKSGDLLFRSIIQDSIKISVNGDQKENNYVEILKANKRLEEFEEISQNWIDDGKGYYLIQDMLARVKQKKAMTAAVNAINNVSVVNREFAI